MAHMVQSEDYFTSSITVFLIWDPLGQCLHCGVGFSI